MAQFKNPKYTKAGTINVELLHPTHGWIPFTANPNDTEAFGRKVHADILASGVAIQAYVPDLEVEADAIRYDRGLLLSGVDTLVSNPLRWASIKDADKAAVVDYRQALLDITAQAGFPLEVVWPTVPDILKGVV